MKIVLALTAFTLASSFAACMAKEDTDASESEFQSADRDKMPDLPYFNR